MITQVLFRELDDFIATKRFKIYLNGSQTNIFASTGKPCCGSIGKSRLLADKIYGRATVEHQLRHPHGAFLASEPQIINPKGPGRCVVRIFSPPGNNHVDGRQVRTFGLSLQLLGCFNRVGTGKHIRISTQGHPDSFVKGLGCGKGCHTDQGGQVKIPSNRHDHVPSCRSVF